MARALPDTERQQNGIPEDKGGTALPAEVTPPWTDSTHTEPDLPPPHGADAAEPVPALSADPEELEQLRRENNALQRVIARREQELQERIEETEQAWAERQKEYEGLLEEKSELIRT